MDNGVISVQGTVVNKRMAEALQHALQGWGVEYEDPLAPGIFDIDREPVVVAKTIEKYLAEVKGIKLYTMDRDQLRTMARAVRVGSGLSIHVIGDLLWDPRHDSRRGFGEYNRQALVRLFKLGGKVLIMRDEEDIRGRCLWMPDLLFSPVGVNVNEVLSFLKLAGKVDKDTEWWSCSGGVFQEPMGVPGIGKYHEGGISGREVTPNRAVRVDDGAMYSPQYRRYNLYCEYCFQRIAKSVSNYLYGSSQAFQIHCCEDCKSKALATIHMPWAATFRICVHRAIQENGDEPTPPTQMRWMDQVLSNMQTASSREGWPVLTDLPVPEVLDNTALGGDRTTALNRLVSESLFLRDHSALSNQRHLDLVIDIVSRRTHNWRGSYYTGEEELTDFERAAVAHLNAYDTTLAEKLASVISNSGGHSEQLVLWAYYMLYFWEGDERYQLDIHEPLVIAKTVLEMANIQLVGPYAPDRNEYIVTAAVTCIESSVDGAVEYLNSYDITFLDHRV